MGKRKIGDKLFALTAAIIVTIMVYAIFMGQHLWSNIVTFEKSIDNLKQCYPAFIKVLEYIKNGRLLGVDGGTFNGATEFFYRSNLPNMYPFVWTAALLMNFFERRGIYLLFYAVHLFAAVYFAQRLGNKYFSLNRWLSLLFAVGIARIAISEMWYLSHFIVACLVCPLIYSSIEALHNEKRIKWILYSVPYVMAFTSGYITESVMLAGISFLVTLIYGMLQGGQKKATVWIRSLIPPVIAGVACFPYCLQLLIYMKDVVQNASSSLHDTLYYKMSVKDLIGVFSEAYLPFAPIEQSWLLTLGMVWIVLIIWVIRYRIYEIKDKKVNVLLGSAVGANVFVVLISLGIMTPVAMWFYTFVPVFGSMHLPLRYLMLTLPFFYLALCKCVSYVPEQKSKKIYRNTAFAALGAIVVLSVWSRTNIITFLDVDKFLIELIFLAVICLLLYNYGIDRKFLIVCCLAILFPALSSFYKDNEVDVFKSTIEERSIVYNEKYAAILDGYIQKLPDKERYMYAMYDSLQPVPDFIPGNYEWYGISEYNLCNYMGYELSLCVPRDYYQHFYWFNAMDWEYIADTRGDFIVLDNASIEESLDMLGIMIDWDQSYTFIDNTHRILTFKKFIPKHYTGGVPYQPDHEDSLDNGYFYSPDLRAYDVDDFYTDKATYYRVEINAETETDLAFLLYPNRFYKYYVDEVEITPVVEDMRVYIPLSKGTHKVEVKYVDSLGSVCNIVFAVYYVLAGIAAVVCGGICILSGKKKGKELQNV